MRGNKTQKLWTYCMEDGGIYYLYIIEIQIIK